MTSHASTKQSISGIVTSSTGERHVPSSVRADGSVRKEIRVRAGFRPQEDVEVFKSRAAEAYKTRGKGGVPGATFVKDENTTKKSPKTHGKLEIRTAQAMESINKGHTAQVEAVTVTAEAPVKEELLHSSATTKSTDAKSQTATAQIVASVKEEPIDAEAEKDKLAKKLAKKLRQARDIEQKKEKGDSLLPDQLEKLMRVKEIIRQLDSMGYDTEARKKT